MFLIRDILNNLDFFLRKSIKISRGKYLPLNESKTDLFNDLNNQNRASAENKEQEYLEKYRLKILKDNSSRRNYLENLYIIELLDKCLSDQLNNDNIEILDIGSKNWFYAAGEYHFFKYSDFEKNIKLTGIEIDPYRIYSNLHSRIDYAKYYIKNLKNTEYITGNVLNHNKKYDYITWFLPFVTKKPHLSWGLPLKHFQPEKLLFHAYNLLKKNGKILIVNQGEKEYLEQERLLKNLNIPYFKMGNFESTFLNYIHDRFVIVVEKS